MEDRYEQTVMVDEPLNATLGRLAVIAQKTASMKADFAAWFDSQNPQPIRCAIHATELKPDFEASWERAYRSKSNFVVHERCLPCFQEEVFASMSDRLVQFHGVTEDIKHASFGGFKPETPEEQKALDACKEWATKPSGFIILYGKIGSGKSHLLASIIRWCGFGQYRTHEHIVGQMRAGYGSEYEHVAAKRAFEKLRGCRLLVWDEFGLGGSGADIPEMIHGVLSHRYEHNLPTALAFNGSLDDFKRLVGDRLESRIRQRLFGKPIFFNGRDRRDNRTFSEKSH